MIYLYAVEFFHTFNSVPAFKQLLQSQPQA